MTWLIFIGVGLALFGSVYWLKPSPRDTRLAELRLDAIRLGLQVRHHVFKVDSAKTGAREDITGTAYTMARPVSHDRTHSDTKDTLKYRVVGQIAWEDDGLSEGLYWHDRPGSELKRDSDEQQKAIAHAAGQLMPVLSELSDDVLLLEVYGNRATLIPAERKTASAAAYHKVLNAVLEQPVDDALSAPV